MDKIRRNLRGAVSLQSRCRSRVVRGAVSRHSPRCSIPSGPGRPRRSIPSGPGRPRSRTRGSSADPSVSPRVFCGGAAGVFRCVSGRSNAACQRERDRRHLHIRSGSAGAAQRSGRVNPGSPEPPAAPAAPELLQLRPAPQPQQDQSHGGG